ncbi:MAG: hypothetical protein QNJ87_09550 [Gammaproteobacteria bacterium]|nr:hypothetical protein [Gammaproteobacteria bacterium]
MLQVLGFGKEVPRLSYIADLNYAPAGSHTSCIGVCDRYFHTAVLKAEKLKNESSSQESCEFQQVASGQENDGRNGIHGEECGSQGTQEPGAAAVEGFAGVECAVRDTPGLLHHVGVAYTDGGLQGQFSLESLVAQQGGAATFPGGQSGDGGPGGVEAHGGP